MHRVIGVATIMLGLVLMLAPSMLSFVPGYLTLDVDREAGAVGDDFRFTGKAVQTGIYVYCYGYDEYDTEIFFKQVTSGEDGSYSFVYTADRPGTLTFYSRALLEVSTGTWGWRDSNTVTITVDEASSAGEGAGGEDTGLSGDEIFDKGPGLLEQLRSLTPALLIGLGMILAFKRR